jgi:hypothetical protein
MRPDAGISRLFRPARVSIPMSCSQLLRTQPVAHHGLEPLDAAHFEGRNRDPSPLELSIERFLPTVPYKLPRPPLSYDLSQQPGAP